MFDFWDRFHDQVLAAKVNKALEHEREAERRRRRYRGPWKPWGLNLQRRAEIPKLLEHRHGGACDTDDTETYLRAILPNLLALYTQSEDPPQAVLSWAKMWLPTIDHEHVVALAQAGMVEELWFPRASLIAKQLGVTNAERTALDLKTIGVADRTKRQRTLDRKKRNAERQREKRARNGATPRAQSKTATQPWRALGIGRSAYYEREWRKKDTIATVTEPDRTISSPIVRSTYTLMTDRSGLQDQAVPGPARRASPNQSVGADRPSPRDKLRVVQTSLTRALPL